ncbi:MAG: 2OG-Fe(II) oxygenase, partial [Acetobacteraceae bacterium]
MTHLARPAPEIVLPSIAGRMAALDWSGISAALDQDGAALLPGVLSVGECAALAADYDRETLFRSRIDMARHGFGRGEYKYFAAPLPPVVAALRTMLYPPLAAIAGRWQGMLGEAETYPARHAEFLEHCHDAGQTRPTPLLLRYETGDYKCLHQDLSGEHVFPLQVVFLLSEPGRDFTGGEFLVVESRPRMQSRALIVPLGRGDGAVFAVHHRPVRGARGFYRATLRHGVSRL